MGKVIHRLDALPSPQGKLEGSMGGIGKMTEFDDVYAGYVIRDKRDGMLLGTGESYRVALREWAARFTKQDAMRFIENSGSPTFFVIEDAT
jgi:hypothetical protein